MNDCFSIRAALMQEISFEPHRQHGKSIMGRNVHVKPPAQRTAMHAGTHTANRSTLGHDLLTQ